MQILSIRKIKKRPAVKRGEPPKKQIYKQIATILLSSKVNAADNALIPFGVHTCLHLSGNQHKDWVTAYF